MIANVLLVDDHSIVLDGIESLLRDDPRLHIVAKVNSGNFALAHLRNTPISLMITDYSMPDMDGLDLVKKAKALHSALKIIVLSMHEDSAIVQNLLCAGIEAYVLKKYTHQELLQAVNVVIQGGQYWSPEINKILIRGISGPADEVSLTEREIEVLKLLTQELTSREIAEKLFISERTVDTHRKNLLRKTQSTGTVGLVKYAFANKLV